MLWWMLAMSPMELPTIDGGAEAPKIVASEKMTAVINRDIGGVRLIYQPLTSDGRFSGPPTSVFRAPSIREGVAEGRFAAASVGELTLVAWQAFGVFWALVDSEGAVVHGPHAVSSDTQRGFPAVAAGDSEFALVYTTRRATMSGSNLVVRFITVDGVATDEREITASGQAFEPDITWMGDRYGVAWRDDRHRGGEIFFRTVSEHQDGPEQALTPNDGVPSVMPDLAWSGSSLGVAWVDFRNVAPKGEPSTSGIPHVRYAQIASGFEAERVVSNPRMHSAEWPALVYSNGNPWVAWSTREPPTDVLVWNEADGIVVLGTRNARAVDGALVGGQPMFVWQAARSKSYRLFGAR